MSVCKACGSLFIIDPSKYYCMAGFCTTDCYDEYLKSNIPLVTCSECGKLYRTSDPGAARAKSSTHDYFWCSTKCVNSWKKKQRERERRNAEEQSRRQRGPHEGPNFEDFREFWNGFFNSHHNRYQYTNSGSGSTTATPRAVEIPPDVWKFLLVNCHPDRHNNSELSNKVTRWLLERKPNE